MKFTGQNGQLYCNRKDLLDTLKILHHTTTKSRPVLSCVRVETVSGGVSLITSNLDTTTYHMADLDGTVDFVASIPIDRLQSYVSDDRGDSVSMSIDEKDVLHATITQAGNAVSSINIPCQTDDFPIKHTDVTDVAGDEISGELLKQAVERITNAIAKQAVQYAMTGVCILQKADQIQFASTDTHRLHVASIPGRIADENAPYNTVVMAEFMRALAHSASKQRVRLELDTRQITAQYGPWTVTGQLIQGRFPKYNDIMDAAFSEQATQWKIPREQLLKALKASAPFCDDRDKAVTFELGNDLRISADGETQMKTHVPITGGGDPVKMQVCNHYMIDALNTTDADEVTLYIKDGKSPVGLVGEPGCAIVIMPIAM